MATQTVPVVFIASSGSKDFSIRQWYYIFTKRNLERPYKMRFQELPGDQESLFVQLDVTSDESAYRYLETLHNQDIATCRFQVLKPKPRQTVLTDFIRRIQPVGDTEINAVLKTLRKVASNILTRQDKFLSLAANNEAVQAKLLRHGGVVPVLEKLGFKWNDDRTKLVLDPSRISEEDVERVVAVCDQVAQGTLTRMGPLNSAPSTTSVLDLNIEDYARTTPGGPTPGGPDDFATDEKSNLSSPPPDGGALFPVTLQLGMDTKEIQLNPRETIRLLLEELSSLYNAQMVQISLSTVQGISFNLDNLDALVDSLGLKPNQNVVLRIDPSVQPNMPRTDQIVPIRRALLMQGSRRGSMQAESATVSNSSARDDNELVTLHCGLCGSVAPAVDGATLRSLKRSSKCSSCGQSYSNGGVHFWLCLNTTGQCVAGYQFCQKCAVDQFKRESNPSYALPSGATGAPATTAKTSATTQPAAGRKN